MAVEVKNQEVTAAYGLYNGDCVEVVPGLPAGSVGLCVYSPPFYDLFGYSDDPRDLSNCKTYGEFMQHYGFLIEEIYRTLMPGRVTAVHCMDLPSFKRSGEEIGLKDFPGDVIRAHQDKGFVYHSRVCIWKDPLIAAVRTKALGLQHKQLVKDSAVSRMGTADYVLAFRKPGINPQPVTNEDGLRDYHGSRPVPGHLSQLRGAPAKNKRAHWIWQQYASPVWFDIRQTRVLPFRAAREPDDLRHICPLQIDVLERVVALWSAPGDVVLDPFMGVGSTPYVAVKNGRKGVGVELKASYYRQAVKNVRLARKEGALANGGEA